MANSALQDKIFTVPKIIMDNIAAAVKSFNGDKTIEGYNRAMNILEKRKIAYSAMKRIKNFFEHYEGERTDASYLLAGGEGMRNWVNSVLGINRDKIKAKKGVMSDIGFTNQFKRTHNKERSRNPGGVAVAKVATSAKRIRDDEAVYEGLSISKIFEQIIIDNHLID